jgi:hypothetical protein
MTTLYIKVSDDEYRLPEKIATTPRELAEWCGVKPTTVKSAISHAKKSGQLSKYIRVEVDEDD